MKEQQIKIFLGISIFPTAWIFNNYSSRPKVEWAIDSEAIRERGIIVLV